MLINRSELAKTSTRAIRWDEAFIWKIIPRLTERSHLAQCKILPSPAGSSLLRHQQAQIRAQLTVRILPVPCQRTIILISAPQEFFASLNKRRL